MITVERSIREGTVERCFGTGDPLYRHYHDTEWGHPLPDNPGKSLLFERLVLEGFRLGLNWVMILRERETFRVAFAGSDPETVASFDEEDIARLMADSGIVRSRTEVRAAIANTKTLVALHVAGGRLADIFAKRAPFPTLTPPESRDEISTRTPEGEALSHRLKDPGLRFVSPVTLYPTMRVIGLVNGHLASYWVREAEA